MKHKLLKNYLKLGILLFGISFFVIACQKDDTVAKEEQSLDTKTPTITTVAYKQAGATFNQLKSTLKIERYLKSRYSTDMQAKTTQDTLGLTIATDLIKQVTLGDYTSYTMEIVHESDSTVFYNLTIEYKNGESSMFATKYTPTAYWLNNKNEAYQGGIQSKKTNTLTEYNDADDIFDEDLVGGNNDHDIGAGVGGGSGTYSSDYPTDCFGTVIVTTELVNYPCGCGDWNIADCDGCKTSSPKWPGSEQVYKYHCQDDGNYGTNPPDDTGGTIGGVSPPDPIDDTSIAVIVKEDEEPTEQKPKSNCQSLKKLVDTDSLGSNILPYVNQLRARINLNKEWSLSYSNEWVNGKTRPVPDTNGVKEGISKTRSKLDYSALWVGQIHTHPKGTFKVFSWLDLKAIKLLYEETNQYFKQDVFIIVVAPNNETYALKINDIQTLTTKIDNDITNAKGANNDKKVDNLMKAMEKEYSKSNNLENTFLNLYGNYGIAFYKATDENLTNWKQLELDNNDDETVNETPCN